MTTPRQFVDGMLNEGTFHYVAVAADGAELGRGEIEANNRWDAKQKVADQLGTQAGFVTIMGD